MGIVRKTVSFVSKGKITDKEKKSMLLYIALVILGTLFVTSVNKLFLNEVIEKFSPTALFLMSLSGMILLYYLFKMD